MAYTLGQAAKVVGRSRTTVFRAVKSGKLSAGRTDEGAYAIDPSELARAFPVDGAANSTGEQSVPPACGFEKREIELLRERIADQADTIADLRTRLSAADARLDAADARFDRLMLTDRRPVTEIKPPPVSWPRRAWRWMRQP